MVLDTNVTILIGLGISGPTISYLAYQAITAWKEVKLAEQAAALKQSLVERGLPAADVQRVLAAGEEAVAGPDELAGVMVACEYDAVTIGRVTARLSGTPDDLRAELADTVRQMVESGNEYDADDLLGYIDARVVTPPALLKPAA